jgi:hypothetical protein
MEGYQVFIVTVTNTTRKVSPPAAPEVERAVIQATINDAPAGASVHVARVRYDHDTGAADILPV